MVANSVADLQQLMVDANKYVAEQHYAICLTSQNIFFIYQPWIKGGFFGQNQALYSEQLLLCSEYEARFWVDENLKKSLGH
jgi:hypothetical protein